MTIEHNNPKDLGPPPKGVYSHVVSTSGKQLFISGQLPRDLAGNLVGPNDIVAQYRQAWENMLTALRASGLGPEHLVKITMFVVGESNLAGIRTVRQEFLLPNPPAMTMVFVSALAQTGALIEIEAIASFPDRS
jgi:enamine deaminase RidA (YjgF/YER057c/UK114 family)